MSSVAPTSGVAPAGTLSPRRMWWSSLRLRLRRWQNRRGAWTKGPSAAPRRAGVRRSGALLLAWPALLIALFCYRSANVFETLAVEQGAEAVLGRAVLLSSGGIVGLLLYAVLGTGGSDPQADADFEWLSTLPAPAWILQAAKATEMALTNPLAWMGLFTLFTGLGGYAGLGLLAPLFALPTSLLVSLASALLSCSMEVLGRRAHQRALRAVRGVALLLALSSGCAWMLAMGIAPIGSALLGDLAGFSDELTWLPFAEPALALLSYARSPLAALGWLALFGVEIAAVLVGSALLLRQTYAGALPEAKPAAHAALTRAAVSAPTRRSWRGLLGPVIGKDLTRFRRVPSFIVRHALVAALYAVLVIALLGPHRGSLAPGLAPGLALYAVGALFVLMDTSLLELERAALQLWTALPRSLGSVFAHKAGFMAALALTGAMPAALGVGLSWSSSAPVWPGLLYGGASVVALAFFNTALWLRSANEAAPSAWAFVWHTQKLLAFALVVGLFAIDEMNGAELAQSWLLVAAFTFAFWTTSVARVPFTLDAGAVRPPAAPTPTFAIVAIFVFSVVQGCTTEVATRRGTSTPGEVAAQAFVIAGSVTSFGSLLWLRLIRGVRGLSERLALGLGRGLRVVLREGLGWCVPALAVNIALLTAFAPEIAEQAKDNAPTALVLAQGPPLVRVLVACVVAPLVEETLFRGLLYRTLREHVGVAASVLVSTIVFALCHRWYVFVPIWWLGVCLALAFERSRSLYAPILLHAGYNAVLTWWPW